MSVSNSVTEVATSRRKGGVIAVALLAASLFFLSIPASAPAASAACNNSSQSGFTANLWAIVNGVPNAYVQVVPQLSECNGDTVYRGTIKDGPAQGYGCAEARWSASQGGAATRTWFTCLASGASGFFDDNNTTSWVQLRTTQPSQAPLKMDYSSSGH